MVNPTIELRFDIKEAAALARITVSEAYQDVQQRRFPRYRWGTRLVFFRSKSEEFHHNLPGVSIQEATERAGEHDVRWFFTMYNHGRGLVQEETSRVLGPQG